MKIFREINEKLKAATKERQRRQAYQHGYRDGQIDRTMCQRYDLGLFGLDSQNEYHAMYSRGYRDGWGGVNGG
jgi:hypothetical protein